MTNPTSTTITILPARLLLVRLPRAHLQSLMAPILDCWWFRGEGDPFFSLCSNEVEVSLFADADAIKTSFKSYLDEASNNSESSDSDSEVDSPADDEDDLETTEGEELEAGESGITLGADKINETKELERARSKLKREKKRRKRMEDDDTDQEKVKVGKDVWVVLECAFHGDGWDEAGRRIRDLSSPLADAGVSILFLSTYNSDFLLVKHESLEAVTSILEQSGFHFNATDDDEDDTNDHALGGSTSDLQRGGSFRRSRARAESSSTYGSGSGRAGGSLSGSLIMSDRGSSHNGSVSRAPNNGAAATVMSRSGSISDRVAAATSAMQQASLSPTRPGRPETLMLSEPLSSSDFSAPGSPAHALRPFSTAAFTSSNSISILPDELVCIGLSQQHETLWRSKIVECLFFPKRVLPPHPAHLADRSSTITLSSPARSRIPTVYETSTGTARKASPLHTPPLSRKPSNARRNIDASTNGASGASRSSSSHLLSPVSSGTSSLHPLAASFVSTLESDYPTPFIALTQTVEGVSLTADVRLLRKVFKDGEDDDVCFTVGQGGLRGVWQGEDGVSSEGEDNSDQEEVVEGRGPRRGRERTRSDDFFDSPQQGEGREEEELTSGNESSSSRSGSRGLDALRERKLKAKEAGEGGRRLLKCLQLDLVSFGLDKHGIVEHFAGLLVNEGLNCLYQSTFSTANILVSKNDIVRARRILEDHGQLA